MCIKYSQVKIPVDVPLSLVAPGEGGFDHGHRLGSMAEGQRAQRAGVFAACDRGCSHSDTGVAQGDGGSGPGDR